ncbi:MAG: septal ring lytic transglycosylase RlpA family protein [Erythrobacter sp.]|nr:septal ring lytic transglycosylase RlpA family protein [Erythrobacter sp.]
MKTGISTATLKARSLRAALVAVSLGMAPLAASTAATPSGNALPLEASAEIAASAEIVPLVEAPIDTPAESQPVEAAVATPLGSGSASYYASKFHGRRTASGEAFDNGAMTAAHRSLPFGSLVRVTNIANGRSVVVRINDRGPFTRGRMIDVSRAAADELGLVARGHATVELELIES